MFRFVTLRQGIQFILVTVGIIVLTSFSIDATDTLRGSQTALSILAGKVNETECPTGMVRVDGDIPFCIDQYENGVGPECLVPAPESPSETALNAVDADCMAESVEGALPWRYVTRAQAEQLCARSGKRLPTPEEWYAAALGTIDSLACNQSGQLQSAGSFPECRSGAQVYDMVGNVWEFVQGDIEGGEYNRDTLPPPGYVAAITAGGFPLQTTTTPQTIYNNDYFWSNATGSYALMRGGYYGSNTDGGLYSAHAMIGLDFSSGAIGFRCAKSL
jgi:Sulfatase-modifying factor enzyme 1